MYLRDRMPRALMLDRFNNVRRVKPLTAEHKIPFLFLHGQADTIVPIKFSQKFYNALPEGNKEFISWPDANHNELPMCRNYLEYIDRFLTRHGMAAPLGRL